MAKTSLNYVILEMNVMFVHSKKYDGITSVTRCQKKKPFFFLSCQSMIDHSGKWVRNDRKSKRNILSLNTQPIIIRKQKLDFISASIRISTFKKEKSVKILIFLEVIFG